MSWHAVYHGHFECNDGHFECNRDKDPISAPDSRATGDEIVAPSHAPRGEVGLTLA